jgi:hypothetical protein
VSLLSCVTAALCHCCPLSPLPSVTAALCHCCQCCPVSLSPSVHVSLLSLLPCYPLPLLPSTIAAMCPLTVLTDSPRSPSTALQDDSTDFILPLTHDASLRKMEMFCCSPSFFEALGMDQLYTALNYDTTFGHKFYVHCASANLFIFKQKPLHLVFVTMSQRKLQSSHEAGLELILGLNPNLRQCRAASRDLEQGIANALQAKFPFAIIFSDGKHVWSLLSEKFEKDDVPKPMRRYIEQRLTATIALCSTHGCRS